MAKKEVVKTQEQVEKDGNVNLSVGEQKLVKVRLKGGKYNGIVTEVPELKALNMVEAGKAEKVNNPKIKVIPSENHENEAGKLKRKEDVKTEPEK